MLNQQASEIKELKPIENFCAQEIPESRWLDYKQDFQPGNKANYQVAKVVSAMANAHGGWILYGIKERRDSQNRGIPDGFTGVLKSTGLGERIKQICLERIYPPIVPDVGAVELTDEREVILVRVFESDSTPHEMTDGKVYVRTNDISHIADDGKEANVKDIQFLLNRRAKAVELRERLLSRAVERCNLGTNFPQFSFSCTPTFPDKPICTYDDLTKAAKGLGKFESFYGLGARVQTAHESVLQKFLRRGGHEYSEQESFCEISLYGSMYFRSVHYVNDDMKNYGGGFGIDSLGSAGLIYSLVQASDWFLQALNFSGLVDISVGLHCVNCAAIVFPPTSAYIHHLDRVQDNNFLVSRRTLSNNFFSLQFIENMYREYLWSAGMGPESWTWDRPTEVINMVHHNLNHSHPMRPE